MNSDFFKRKLFTYVFTGFLLGIVISKKDTPNLEYLFLSLSCFVFLFGNFHRKSIFFSHHLLIGFFLLFVSFGLVRTNSATTRDMIPIENLNRTIVVKMKVISDRENTEFSTRVVVSSGGIKMLAYFPKETNIFYGDLVEAKGIVTLPESFLTESGRTFDYNRYLMKDGIGYLFRTIEEPVLVGHVFGYREILYSVRKDFIDQIDKSFFKPQSDLLAGMLLGLKRGKDLERSFRISGLSHIVVLSGYNISILIIFVSSFLKKADRSLKLSVILFFVFIFTIMVSGGASTLRAAIMSSSVLLADSLHRRISAWRALFLASFLMLLISPTILFYDPGFQLSFLATSGLIVFSRYLTGKMTFITERFGIREACSSSFSAQVSVLPFVVYLSGYVSLVSMPANILVLPLVAPAMLMGFTTLLIGYFWGPISTLFAYVTSVILGCILTISDFFAGLPFAVYNVHVSRVYIIFIYAVAAAVCIWREQKKNRHFVDSFNLMVGRQLSYEPYSQNLQQQSSS